MVAFKPNLGVLAVLFIIGMGSIARFSQGVRPVAVLGLSGAGAACGAAVFGIIFALASKRRSS